MADPITGGFDIPVGGDITDTMISYMQTLGTLRIQAAGLALSHDQSMAAIGAQMQASANQLQASLASVAASQRASDQQYDVDLRQLGLAAADLNYRQRTSQVQAQLQTIDSGVNQMKAQAEVAMANFTQRAGVADRKMGIAQMLADRSGPRNLVSYNSLVNMLSPEAPEGGTTTVDPFSWLDNLYEPISDELPEWAQGITPDPNSIYQQYDSGSAQGAPIGAGYGGEGGGAPQVPFQHTTAPSAQNALDWINGMFDPNAPGNAPAPTGEVGFPIANVQKGWNLITMGPGGDIARDQFDPSIQQVYGADAYDPATGQVRPGAQQVTTAKAGQPHWVFRAAAGGRVGARRHEMEEDGAGGYTIGPVLVGDNPEPTPSGNEEIATVKTDDPNARLDIQPVNPKGLAAQSAGDGSGTQVGGDPMSVVQAAITEAVSALSAANDALMAMTSGMPPEGAMPPEGMPPEGMSMPPGPVEGEGLAALLGPPPPAAAAGGSFGNEVGEQVDYHGFQPFTGMPAADTSYRPAPAPMPFQGIPQNVAQAQNPLPGGFHNGGMGNFDLSGVLGRLRQLFASPGQRGQPGIPGGAPGPTTAPGPMVDERMEGPFGGPVGLGEFRNPGIPGGAPGPTTMPPVRVGGPGGGPIWAPGLTSNVLAQSMGSSYPGRIGGPMPMTRAAGGGSFDPNASADESYGAGNTNPVISVHRYSPEQIAQMPARRMLTGDMRGTPAFGKPGMKIANPAVGIDNFSPFVNLQRYADLDDTGRDLWYSLWEQGLEQDSRDIMRRSLASAPGAAQWQQGMARVG